jgi:hypothetical protein
MPLLVAAPTTKGGRFRLFRLIEMKIGTGRKDCFTCSLVHRSCNSCTFLHAKNASARENSPLETLFAMATAHHHFLHESFTIIAYDAANIHTGWYVLNIHRCALMMDI